MPIVTDGLQTGAAGQVDPPRKSQRPAAIESARGGVGPMSLSTLILSFSIVGLSLLLRLVIDNLEPDAR
jgi:hypothetical protein